MKFTKKIVLFLIVLVLALSVSIGMIACDKAPTTDGVSQNVQQGSQQGTDEGAQQGASQGAQQGADEGAAGDPQAETITSVKTLEDGTLVFTQDNAILADVAGKHVVDYMSALKAQGYIEYEMTGSMVTTVGGKGVDSSKHEFWAFYTTDTENSSDMYGDPIVIDGVIYHSANFGIVDMPLKAGAGYAFKVTTW